MNKNIDLKNTQPPFVVILGIAQDGGVPQAGCKRSCCLGSPMRHMVVSLGVVDPSKNQRWLVDVTPDITDQLALLDMIFSVDIKAPGLDGVFITHGHMGHFTGLLQFERAAMNTTGVIVHTMPRMAALLSNNLPWKDLVTRKNIILHGLHSGKRVILNDHLSVTPCIVPHRDEHTETVGFIISGPLKKVLFIPDIDRWEGFPQIRKLISNVDVALLDGTLFDETELPNRNIKEIPHPYISHSVKFFASLSQTDRNKLQFVHFNHTNPVLDQKSDAHTLVIKKGFHIAQEGKIISI